MKNQNKYSILVNSTDSFEDCWIPFFTLFKNYWPDYTGNILLNTETKSFTFSGLNIVSIQNNKATPNKTITWSECLNNALSSTEDEIILYMQEDYFIKSYVQNEIINEFANMMSNNNIDCIHLTDQNSPGPFSPSNFNDLWLLDEKAPYRVSCQAALWKKSVLINLLRLHENPWQFEKYGTKRSQFLNYKFYTVDRDKYKLNVNEIIPYVFTGIIQGRWYEEVIPLFESHHISVNYSLRGFTKNAAKKTFANSLFRRMKSIPTLYKNFWDQKRLKTLRKINS